MPDSGSTLTAVRVCIAVLLFFTYTIAQPSPPIGKLEQSVVRVIIKTSEGFGTGTGFVLNTDGYVATSHHVVDGSEIIQILPSNSMDPLQAVVIWSSPEYDIAVMKVTGLARPPVILAIDTPDKGEPVYALGYPGIADRITAAIDPTVTGGLLGRTFLGSWGSGASLELIQHSAQINPGNSGGPLFDECGRVIGINSQGSGSRIIRDDSGKLVDIYAGVGVYFASQITVLSRHLRDIGVAFTESKRACVAVTESKQAIEAGESATRAVSIAESANENLQALSRNMVRWSLVTLLLTSLALALALRRPRERVINAMRDYSQSISREVSHVINKTNRLRKQDSPRNGLILNGLAHDGSAIRISLTKALFLSERQGLVLGRNPYLVHAVLDQPKISRRHARIRWHKHGWQMQDLNSAYGTKINTMTLQPYSWCPLNEADHISFGEIDFFVSQGS